MVSRSATFVHLGLAIPCIAASNVACRFCRELVAMLHQRERRGEEGCACLSPSSSRLESLGKLNGRSKLPLRCPIDYRCLSVTYSTFWWFKFLFGFSTPTAVPQSLLGSETHSPSEYCTPACCWGGARRGATAGRATSGESLPDRAGGGRDSKECPPSDARFVLTRRAK